jgi:hypothetical protein
MGGNKYVGEYRNGKLNGQGIYRFAEGHTYIGEFKEDKRNGQGTLIFAGGNKYVGEFKDDMRNGQGTFTTVSGDKYVGEFKDEKPNGYGSYTYASGNKYVGEYKEGWANGHGIEYSISGTVARQGLWENGNLIKSFPLDTQRIPFIPKVEVSAPSVQVTNLAETERSTASTDLQVAQNKCRELGFKPKTEGFGKCVLQLSK